MFEFQFPCLEIFDKYGPTSATWNEGIFTIVVFRPLSHDDKQEIFSKGYKESLEETKTFYIDILRIA